MKNRVEYIGNLPDIGRAFGFRIYPHMKSLRREVQIIITDEELLSFVNGPSAFIEMKIAEAEKVLEQ